MNETVGNRIAKFRKAKNMTHLIFSKGTVWLANHFGRKYAADAMKDISPEALERPFAEFRRIKRTYGRWELVEVHSADGQEVYITL